MKKILLILSFLRNSPKSVDEAIKLAKKNHAELVVFFVLDIDFANRIVDKLTDEGWIGGKPSEQLYLSLLKEYRLQSEMRISEIEQCARQQDVRVRSIVRSGSVLDEILRVTQLEDPDLIVINRRKRSNLSRLIFGSVVNALERQVSCEVKIIDAE
ncbi:MAG: universal stress protein [bacterium]